MTAVTVVVDFGGADTVVVATPPERLVAVEPSVVLLDRDDRLVAGHEATRAADPAFAPTFEPTTVADRLDERETLVGETVLPVNALVRALLARAVGPVDRIDELVVAHPAGWPPARVEVLARAASGLAPRVSTVAAPVAAAAGADLEPGATLLVVSCDAATCEATAVRRTEAGELEVLAHGAAEPGDSGSLVERVVAETPVDRVLLVGAGPLPVVGRRVSEAVRRPVRLAADPEQAVARGALRLATPVPVSVEESVPAAPRPLRLRRRVVVAAALLVMAVAAAAVTVVGIGPGRLTAGLPGPAAASSSPGLPPVVDGRELVADGRQPFAGGRMGTPVRHRHPSGTTLELTVSDVRVESRAPAPLGEAPLGYRWVTVVLRGVHVSGPAWRQDVADTVAAMDDRGQWIRPLAGTPVGCASPLPDVVEPASSFDACVPLPVPESTPVTAVVVGAPGTTPPVRFPASVPSASDAPAPARDVGRLGEPLVEVAVDGVDVRAGADLVLTPSGYLGDRSPAPGHRYVVVRARLPAEHLYLRDDRGVLTGARTGFDTMLDCPSFTAPPEPGTAVYACFVYELAAEATVAGVTLGGPLTTGRDVETWPTWTVD
ncbi:hypothetical protein [Actinophytocola gossypii]|uniref:Type VII secretion-associated protein n=1 Tax=Actinophytocola gossypii TaxID=2812003 RepID=A0ABT2J8D7_9PSEU|nr:hypothetical protein [Actinophytocola gossypii]MCT2584128.1 hypothetical protein [Actinophytocola gossypii]